MNSLRAFLICVAITAIIFLVLVVAGRPAVEVWGEARPMIVGAGWGLLVREIWMLVR